MRKIKLLIILLIGCYNLINAQKITISGTVLESDSKQKLEYATIILKPVDKSTVTGGITNINGKFNVEIKKGTYKVSVEYISFLTKDLGIKTFTKNTNLGVIYLKEDADSLDEIEIIAEKSTVEIRLDKKIYNVGKDMTVKGGTASDVLNNVPSVTVDVEGNVSLRGNDNVSILINGKPSNFSADEALRQLPANAIKKVEVITSPSARYDAEGTAGIVNIILRKGKAQGLNGTTSINTANFTGYGISTNFNYRVKKFNFFNTNGYSYRDIPGNAVFENTYLQENDNRYGIENRYYDRLRKTINTRFGITYSITDKSSVTGSVSYKNSDRFTDTGISLSTQNINHIETAYSTRNELEDRNDESLEYQFNFTQKFKTSGQKLTFDITYDFSNDDEYATVIGEEFKPAHIITLKEKISALENTNSFIIKSDYVLPIGENGQFEIGAKYSVSEITTDYTLREEQVDGSYIINNNISNLFTFKDKTSAIYTQLGNKFGDFSILAGLRMEHTNIDIISQNSPNNKNYTEWFPTLNLSYQISDRNDISLGYNRRIRRPRPYFLNPFETRYSQTNIFQGNPNLDPSYINGVDLGYLKKWQILTFNTSVYYNYTTNVFQFIRENTDLQTDAGIPIIRTIPRNIASENRYGMEFSIDYKAIKWLKLTSSFNFFHMDRNGNNYIPNSKTDSWNTRFTSRVKLPFKIDWQTTISYRGAYENFQSKIEPITVINLSLSKDLFKDKATISLNTSDLLNTRKRISLTLIEDFSSTYSEFQYRERQIMLNFTYRFNKKKGREHSGKKSIRYSDDG